jgi:hypothetical protein
LFLVINNGKLNADIINLIVKTNPMLETFISKFKMLLNSPMVIFIYGIISKWYIMVMVPAIIVVFWVLKGLTSTGILPATEKIVTSALEDTKSVARYCVPKITNLPAFWQCLSRPPKYEPTKEEKEFESNAKALLNFDSYNQNKDPYAK